VTPRAHSGTDFREHRGPLFGVAYGMLGTITEAEDAVQEAYQRYRSTEMVIANREPSSSRS